MCMINEEIADVSNTKIFIAHLGKLQLTMYENKIELLNGRPNAMILPFPAHGGVDFKLPINDEKAIDTVEELFKIAKDCFPKSRGMSKYCNSAVTSESYLKIEEVGSYSVSVAEGVEDLVRFDPSVFNINKNLLNVIMMRYKSGFGFLICQLNESKKYHPFTYVHGAITPSTIFIPTYHYHEHDTGDMEIEQGDWDHTIYVVSNNSVGTIGLLDNNIKSAELPESFIVKHADIPSSCQTRFKYWFSEFLPQYNPSENFNNIVKISINGPSDNGDIIIEFTTRKEEKSISITCDICSHKNIQVPFYHCSVCDDVDFCDDCVNDSLHLNPKLRLPGHNLRHSLLRIDHISQR